MNPPPFLYVPTSSPLRPVRVSPEDYYALTDLLASGEAALHVVGRGRTTAVILLIGPRKDNVRKALSRWVYERAHGVELTKQDLVVRHAKGDQFLFTRENLSLIKVGECRYSRPKKHGCALPPREYWQTVNAQFAQ
ncbi:MAG: hypothetical protein BWY99_01469 [Synergistetes bacterium ADurb.BinA166]|nr:MAG: hypothetical protein BWY99_01469 [Synergistetes bacterium ADurb.BinA166]